MENPFFTLQTAVKDRLKEVGYFFDIPVITEDAGDIETEIMSALARGCVAPGDTPKTGAAIALRTPRTSAREGKSSLIVADTTLRVVVYEQGIINRSPTGIGKPALDIIHAVMRQLHHWRRNPGQSPARFVEFDSDFDADGTLIYYADFTFTIGLELNPANLIP
jgi:hypothetical protein